MTWTKENNPHSGKKQSIDAHAVKLSWDQENKTRVLTIDGHTVPGVKRVYVESLVHSFELHIVLEDINFEIEGDTANIELEEYTGG